MSESKKNRQKSKKYVHYVAWSPMSLKWLIFFFTNSYSTFLRKAILILSIHAQIRSICPNHNNPNYRTWLCWPVWVGFLDLDKRIKIILIINVAKPKFNLMSSLPSFYPESSQPIKSTVYTSLFFYSRWKNYKDTLKNDKYVLK